MKKLIKTAILAAAGIGLVSTGAQAAQSPFELGFTGNGAANDYIIDIGNTAASIGVGGTSVVDLSSDFSASTFNSTFTSGASGVNMGVVSGNGSLGSYNIYATQLRSGGAGIAADAGSTLSGQPSSTTISSAAGSLTGNGWSTTVGGNVTPLATASTSFSSKVEASGTTSFYGKTGVQPSSAIGSSGIIYEDLWYTSQATGNVSPWTYEGYFTFNDNNDSLTFTPAGVAVPEPTTYGLFAALGLLALSVRGQFVRKNA